MIGEVVIPICPAWLLGAEFFAGVVVGVGLTMLISRSRRRR